MSRFLAVSRQFGIEPLEPRRLLASDPIGVWTGLGDGITWHDPENWSQNVLPGIDDNVVLDVPVRTTILVSEPVAVRSIDSSEVLDITSELSVQHDSHFSAPVRLDGTLAGSGSLTFASTLDWIGGILDGGGALVVPPGAELNIELPGGPPGLVTHQLHRSIDNFGTVNLRTGQPATLTVSGCYFHNQPGAVVNLARGSVFLDGDDAVIRNSGTFNIKREALLGSALEFINEGTVNSEGELHLHAGGSSSGSFIVNGWLSFFSDYAMQSDSQVSGLGAVNFYASATVDGAITNLHLLAIATTEAPGVAFSGPVSVNHLVCINDSTVPDLPIARFNGPTVAGVMEVVAGHVQFDGPLTSSRTLVRAYQQRPATLEMGSHVPDLGDLEINDSSVQLQSGERPIRAMRITSLAGSGKWNLDLGNGAMVVDYEETSPLIQIREALTSGYANRAWNGVGINSIDASFSTDQALGYAEASDLFSAFPVLFGGLEVDDTSILVRHTRYGDANLDRQVDLTDFNHLVANFGAGESVWSQGNFNYDNNTDLADFNMLVSQFGEPTQSDNVIDDRLEWLS